MNHKTHQETFWAGEFGNQYIDRNTADQFLSSNIAFFAKILSRTCDIESVLEFGPNVGLNLRAIKHLLDVEISGVEINQKAFDELKATLPEVTAYHASALNWEIDKQRDLVFTKGVLIHIDPDALPLIYQKLYDASSKYVLIAEYYSPVPIAIEYRGHGDKLFKRDFAGELFDTFPDLKLVDYGFQWRRDPNFMQGDLTWFLAKKS